MKKTALIQIRVTQIERNRLMLVALKRGQKLSEMLRNKMKEIDK